MLNQLRALVLVVSAFLVACGEGDSFSNSLRFGTGVAAPDYFTLVGESSSFSLAALGDSPVWFRLESAEDINKRFVRLYFDDITNKDFTPPQDYGHIMLSSFSVSNPGTFQVKGFYVKTVIDIGEETFVASAPLTITH